MAFEEIIKIKNKSYSRYEELLLRRDALKKEAFQYERAYIREFGDLLLEIFQLKIECIRKKKTIEYCQAEANHGRSVDSEKLNEYLAKELWTFTEQFDEMVKDNEAAKNSETITEKDLLQIKKIYHRTVKLIHPDINPITNESDQLKELWQRLITAYNCNDLKFMEETEVLILNFLEKVWDDDDEVEFDIPDINDKIEDLEKEIKIIRETDPYQYKYILEDDELTRAKKDSLLEEKKSYEDYNEQLDKILEELLKNGVSLTWRMN